MTRWVGVLLMTGMMAFHPLGPVAGQTLDPASECGELDGEHRTICRDANAGAARAIAALAWARSSGRGGVASDATEAMRLFRVMAERGDAEGLVGLGIHYDTGRGVASDPVAARALFEIGMARGSDRAKSHFAELLGAGAGGPADAARAERLLAEADRAGDAYAPAVIAMLRADGVLPGATPDSQLELWRRAADRGHPAGLNGVAWDVVWRQSAPARAIPLAERAVAAEPENFAHLHTLGYALWRNGDAARAAPLLERAAEIGGLRCPFCMEHWGDVLAARGDADRARGFWGNALEAQELNPDRDFDATSVRRKLGR